MKTVVVPNRIALHGSATAAVVDVNTIGGVPTSDRRMTTRRSLLSCTRRKSHLNMVVEVVIGVIVTD